ncbi:MAG: hypothetical protein AAB519_02815 [Patescibacteria group bacterium]
MLLSFLGKEKSGPDVSGHRSRRFVDSAHSRSFQRRALRLVVVQDVIGIHSREKEDLVLPDQRIFGGAVLTRKAITADQDEEVFEVQPLYITRRHSRELIGHENSRRVALSDTPREHIFELDQIGAEIDLRVWKPFIDLNQEMHPGLSIATATGMPMRETKQEQHTYPLRHQVPSLFYILSTKLGSYGDTK